MPDEESLGGARVRIDDPDGYTQLGPEDRDVFRHVAGGAPVYPLVLPVEVGEGWAVR